MRQCVRAALTDGGKVVLGQAFHLATAIDTPMTVGTFDFFPLCGGQVVGRARSHCGTPAIGFGLYPVRMLRVPVGMLLAQGHPVRCIIRRTLGIHQSFVLPVVSFASRLFFRFMRLFIGMSFLRILALPACDSCTHLLRMLGTISQTSLALTQDTARSFAIAGVLVNTKLIEGFQQIASTTDFVHRGFHRGLLTEVKVSTWLPCK